MYSYTYRYNITPMKRTVRHRIGDEYRYITVIKIPTRHMLKNTSSQSLFSCSSTTMLGKRRARAGAPAPACPPSGCAPPAAPCCSAAAVATTSPPLVPGAVAVPSPASPPAAADAPAAIGAVVGVCWPEGIGSPGVVGRKLLAPLPAGLEAAAAAVAGMLPDEGNPLAYGAVAMQG